MRSLEQIAEWPVDHASALVVDLDGAVLGTHGEQRRIYQLASVTKILAAYAVLIAVEEGAVELDQPAGPPGSTLRHLLAHASGLDFDSDTVRAEPGARRIYSNTGFDQIGAVMEDACEMTFAEYLREAVLDPLGMASTRLEGSPAHAASSTSEDLGRFAAELLSPRLLHASTLDDARRVQFPGLDGVLPGYGRQRPCDWGLGFSLKGGKSPHWTAPEGSPETFGHFGQAGTFLWVDPQAGIATVALTDRPFGAWAAQVWPVLGQAILDESA